MRKLIDYDETLAALALKAHEEVADANHHYLKGFMDAVDVVEAMEPVMTEEETEDKT